LRPTAITSKTAHPRLEDELDVLFEEDLDELELELELLLELEKLEDVLEEELEDELLGPITTVGHTACPDQLPLH
jgi:hypothetical protein